MWLKRSNAPLHIHIMLNVVCSSTNLRKTKILADPYRSTGMLTQQYTQLHTHTHNYINVPRYCIVENFARVFLNLSNWKKLPN